MVLHANETKENGWKAYDFNENVWIKINCYDADGDLSFIELRPHKKVECNFIEIKFFFFIFCGLLGRMK